MTLNERVARVKGYKPITARSSFPMPSGFDLYQDRATGQHHCRNWSGFIADAWELVEEMREHEPVTITVTQGRNKTRAIVTAGPHTVDGDTAQAAICVAYLAMMEGEDA